MNRSTSGFHRHALATAVVLALAGTAHAQLSSATIKGQITGATAAAGSVVVTAVNLANGNTYRTTILADGSYVLAGLAPGSYQIRVGSQTSQDITVQVGETASLDLSVGGAQQITIVGTLGRKDVKSSELGTNVSRKMIELLPQSSRNFMSSADLAPGVVFTSDNQGNTGLQAGAQNNDHVNVFIDGVGQKNNILRGGIAGQQTSPGNPFPQSAIAEYKILTQNYKAEFEQVSSAAITAVTKSGTNTLHGDAFIDRTGTNWRAKSEFEKERIAQGAPLQPSSKNEYGFSLGGAIKEDVAHFFVAFDGKEIDKSRQVVPRNLDKLPAGQGIVPELAASGGSHVDPFREKLLFGKVDAQLSDEQKLSASIRLRRESNHRPEDDNLSAPGNDKDISNDETRFDVRHEWARDAFLNELRLGYEEFAWNPHSAATAPFFKNKVANTAPPGPQLLSASDDVIFTGGSPDAQNRAQKGQYVADDLTYTGLKGHVIKGGIKLKAMTYDLSGTRRSVDVVQRLIDRVTGQPYYAGGLCTGTNVSSSGLDSDQCHIEKALASVDVHYRNNQLGLYIQDDWAVTKQLELNLGVRYDYETNMLNNDYVTPADRVAALNAIDGRTIAGIVAPPGQTYAQSLAKGGINVADYIATGNSRKDFKGAIAPRVGASYDLAGDRSTVVFGGWGRSYDRTMANHAIDELQNNATPNGEVWLIKNDFKMPFADQFTLGLRQALGQWNAEIALSRVEAKNQFILFSGNRDPNGGFGSTQSYDPLFGGPNGFGNLILGDFVGKTKTDSLFLKLEKPFTRSSGWGLNLAYTYNEAKTTSNTWDSDVFDMTYGKSTYGYATSKLVDKHRLVIAGVMDGFNFLPSGMALSAKATFASGLPHRVTSCAAGFDKCKFVEGDGKVFRQVDVGVSQALKFGSQSVSLRADILNLFNTANYDGADDWGGGPVAPGQPANQFGGDNLNTGKPNSIRGDTRTLRLAINYSF